LVLDSGQDEIELASDRRKCLQEEDERQHHCQIAFVGVNADAEADQLNCDVTNCSLKVKVRAFNSDADGGERVVIGSNQPNGDIEQDKARLNVIRIRPPAIVPEPLTSEPVRNDFAPVLKKVVLYSQRLDGLESGDVIEAAADARARVDHLGYPALLGTQIILADDPRDKNPSGLVRRIATDGEITEISGTNCTPKQSPCPIVRTGITELREDPLVEGQPVPLYVNVIARSKAKRADAEAGDKVKLKDFRGLRVWRYSE
jgi:hypothetical protein